MLPVAVAVLVALLELAVVTDERGFVCLDPLIAENGERNRADRVGLDWLGSHRRGGKNICPENTFFFSFLP